MNTYLYLITAPFGCFGFGKQSYWILCDKCFIFAIVPLLSKGWHHSRETKLSAFCEICGMKVVK